MLIIGKNLHGRRVRENDTEFSERMEGVDVVLSLRMVNLRILIILEVLKDRKIAIRTS